MVKLERLNMDAFDRTAGTLRIDGRESGQERCVPLPDMVLRCLEGLFSPEFAVLPSEIEQIPDLRGYLKLARRRVGSEYEFICGKQFQ